MIGVYALRISVAFMSCAQATNALRMISVVIGAARSRSPLAAGRHLGLLLVAQDEVAAVFDLDRPARRHDRDRALLLDHDGPLGARPGGEAAAPQHLRLVRDAGEDHRPRARGRVRLRAAV